MMDTEAAVPMDPGGDEVKFSDDPLEHSSISAALMTIILITWLILGHKIQGMFRWTRWISEGSMACILGIFSGICLLVWDRFHEHAIRKSLSFSSATFFTYMLPPIIFYGGLAIRRQLFVSNLISIVAFGILGTFISFIILGTTLYWLSLLPNVLRLSDCLALAAIFAATDSVAVLSVLRPEAHPALYSIVLGEGVMNDATSVALLRTVGQLGSDADLSIATAITLGMYFAYLFVTSFAVGLGGGLLIALIMKRLGPFSEPQEVSLVGAIAFLTYLLAELCNLSGILALFFCGMAVSHYALQHISRASRAALLNFFRTLSYLLEGVIFLYVGRDTLDPSKWVHAHFLETLYIVIFVVALIAVSRALFVFPLAWLHNRWSTQPLFFGDGVVIWWAGMMRGAVSVAMVYYRFDPSNTAEDGHASTIVVMTLQVVLLSTVVLGGITGPLLKMVLSRAVHPPAMPGRGLVANDSMTSLSQGLFPGNGTAFTVSAPSSPHRRQDEEADSQHGGNYNAGVGYPNLELSSYPDQSVEDRERLYSSPLRSDGRPTRGGKSNRQPPRRQTTPQTAPDSISLLDAADTPFAPPSDMLTLPDPLHKSLPIPPPTSARPPKPARVPGTTNRPHTLSPALQPSASAHNTGASVDDMERGWLNENNPTRPLGAGGGNGTHAAMGGLGPLAMDSVSAMGRRVLSAATRVAEMSGFEPTEAMAPGADGALGDRLYTRFQDFDAKYMQPMFGADRRDSASGEWGRAEDVGEAPPPARGSPGGPAA